MVAPERVEIPVPIPSPETCSACTLALREAVDKIPGVGGVHIDPKTSLLTAEVDTSVTGAMALTAEVERLGLEIARMVGHESWFVGGLDCPDCAKTVGVSISRIDGVLSADLNFASGVLLVEYDPQVDPRAEVVRMLAAMGYEAEVLGGAEGEAATSEQSEGSTKKRAGVGWLRAHNKDIAIVGSGLLILLGVVLEQVGAGEVVSTIAFAAAMVIGGRFVARRALVSLKTRTLDMNVLMMIAVIGAAAIGEWLEGAMVVFLFAIGGALESRSLAKTRSSIRALMDVAPETVRLLHEGEESMVPPSDVTPGQMIRVRPGERIALDGVVLEGSSAVDESPITGESVPVEKAEGDEVFAGSLCVSGLLRIEVTKLVTQTVLARVVYLVEEAQAQKAPFQRAVDRFTRFYTPIVVALAVLLATVPPIAGAALGADWGGFSEWFYRALVLLVISCPCALVISTPVAVVSAITRATKDGVLVKGGAFLELAPQIRAVAFDKTGTLTIGRPEVAEVIALNGSKSADVLHLAASIEAHSTHPLAQAVVRAADSDLEDGAAQAGPARDSVTQMRETPGRGVVAVSDKTQVLVGSATFARDEDVDIAPAENALAQMEDRGYTVLVVAADGTVEGLIGIADSVRENASEAVGELLDTRIEHAVMLTGDNERTAEAIAGASGVPEFRARLLPGEKVDAVKELQGAYGKVAMVGDGINDAPALAAADIGIAMGAAGSDTALETADVALMSDDLTALPGFFDLGRRTVANIWQNVIVSVGVKLLVLVLAVFGVATLWMAVFADTGVALLVILNGLRLMRAR